MLQTFSLRKGEYLPEFTAGFTLRTKFPVERITPCGCKWSDVFTLVHKAPVKLLCCSLHNSALSTCISSLCFPHWKHSLLLGKFNVFYKVLLLEFFSRAKIVWPIIADDAVSRLIFFSCQWLEWGIILCVFVLNAELTFSVLGFQKG